MRGITDAGRDLLATAAQALERVEADPWQDFREQQEEQLVPLLGALIATSPTMAELTAPVTRQSTEPTCGAVLISTRLML